MREASEACRRGGIKFGFYLSPWDRNSALYGTDAYNDYYKAQLTELLTQYGEIFHVWFDGACGEGPNGRKQEYDFEGYIELIHKYQSNATIFNDAGPDVRWIGNESGTARYAEWAVVPSELCFRAEVQTGPGPLAGDLTHMYNTDQEIGSMSNILYSKGLCFCGSEVDMSIRPGWFYHPEEEPHSLERLLRTYETSVGGNACFHLNIPPMPNGKFDPRDVERLKELGEALRDRFGTCLNEGVQPVRIPAEKGDTQCIFEIDLPEPTDFRYVDLREDLKNFGQRVESFHVRAQNQHGGWDKIFDGTTIGHRRILGDGKMLSARRLRVCITAARGPVEKLEIRLF